MGITMNASLCVENRKPADTGRNRVASQRDFGGVAAVRVALLEQHLIARMSFSGAINECLRHDGREDQQIAAAIHISKGYMSKLIRSVWAAQTKRLIAFMKETRCPAPLQKMADEMGYELRAKKTELEDRLEQAELMAARLKAELEAQKVAA
jgi:hypothetical protein